MKYELLDQLVMATVIFSALCIVSAFLVFVFFDWLDSLSQKKGLVEDWEEYGSTLKSDIADMIKINELRIGNYVAHRMKVTEVSAMNLNNVWVMGDRDYVALTSRSISAIPISEEWLTMFGFVDDGVVWEKDELIIGLYKTGYFHIPSKLILYQSLLSSKTGVAIKSVHQLQNLYFAITGKELTKSEESK